MHMKNVIIAWKCLTLMSHPAFPELVDSILCTSQKLPQVLIEVAENSD